MDVMVIDDQVNVVDGIVSGVDWRRIGVMNVYKAHNIIDSKRIIIEKSVDILVCDIEMPLGSGIELLRWVRENSPKIECIFLTAHAKFEYATEAIKLGSFDYVLQPVKYSELEAIVEKAVEKIIRDQNIDKLTLYGRSYEENAHKYAISTLRDILIGDDESIDFFLNDRMTKKKGITENAVYFPVLVSILRRQTSITMLSDEISEEQITAVAEKCFELKAAVIYTVKMGTGRFVVTIAQKHGELIVDGNITGKYEKFICMCKDGLQATVACYAHRVCTIYELNRVYEKLLRMESDNVGLHSRIFLSNEVNNQEEIKDVDWKRFSLLLANKHSDIVYDEINGYISQLVDEEKVGYNVLFNFVQSFLMMIYSITEKIGVSSSTLFGNPIGYELYDKALNSVENLLEFIKYVLNTADDFVMGEESDSSIIDKVKKYVSDNMGRDISRNDIASFVYLSPEYLSRIFKKEVGIGLSEYIVEEKIKIARSYLAKTSMPISIIASKLGYTNFSYFSKVFKKATDLTPNEYRQQNRLE